jgi:cyclic pyranopterin monophosphate synthase
MVDVTGKPWTRRRAMARCRVVTSRPYVVTRVDGSSEAPSDAEHTWPEVSLAARLAGIQAAKQTPMLIPLCHPLTVSAVDVRLWITRAGIEIESRAETTGPTGVEMEALTACAVAAMTVVCALGPTREDVSVEDLALWEKSGGRSGTWIRAR